VLFTSFLISVSNRFFIKFFDIVDIHNFTMNDQEINFRAVSSNASFGDNLTLQKLNKKVICENSVLIVISSSGLSLLLFA
jgi:hypothetical protein